MISILLVDDYKPWRHLVCSMIRKEPELQVICEVSDGLAAVQRAHESKPDLILLDIGLPKLNGIEAARQIRQVSPNSKIVFFSTDNSVDVVQVALSTGASGYVYKANAQNDLLPAINAVLRRKRFVSRLEGSKLTDAKRTKAPRLNLSPVGTLFTTSLSEAEEL